MIFRVELRGVPRGFVILTPADTAGRLVEAGAIPLSGGLVAVPPADQEIEGILRESSDVTVLGRFGDAQLLRAGVRCTEAIVVDHFYRALEELERIASSSLLGHMDPAEVTARLLRYEDLASSFGLSFSIPPSQLWLQAISSRAAQQMADVL